MIDFRNLKRWIKSESDLRQKINKKKFTLHKGPSTKGPDLEIRLVAEVERLREKSITVSYSTMAEYIMKISNKTFLLHDNEVPVSDPHYSRVYDWVRRVLLRNAYTVRFATHTAQYAEIDVNVVNDFVKAVNDYVLCYCISPDCVLNMDQTAVQFNETPRRTLARRGTRTVKTRSPGVTGGGRATVCLTVVESGTKLNPLVIFKGIYQLINHY
jgi:hypothetical protein